MSTLPPYVQALPPEPQSFLLCGTVSYLRVTGVVTDVENGRSGIWMNLASLEVAGLVIPLDEPVFVFIPADAFPPGTCATCATCE